MGERLKLSSPDKRAKREGVVGVATTPLRPQSVNSLAKLWQLI